MSCSYLQARDVPTILPDVPPVVVELQVVLHDWFKILVDQKVGLHHGCTAEFSRLVEDELVKRGKRRTDGTKRALPQQHVSNLLRGGAPSNNQLRTVCEAFGYALSDVLTDCLKIALKAEADARELAADGRVIVPGGQGAFRDAEARRVFDRANAATAAASASQRSSTKPRPSRRRRGEPEGEDRPSTRRRKRRTDATPGVRPPDSEDPT